MSDKPIIIDGSQGEGGGQLLRNTIALSAIANCPVRIHNIRKNRRNPGLRPQHLHAIEVVRQLCEGTATGLKENSPEVHFYPQKIRDGHFSSDIGTAGSITLLLQCVLPVLAFASAKTVLKIRGGTSVKWSPPFPYMENILLPILSKNMGFAPKLQLVRRGYYPKGGGLVTVEATPATQIKPISLTERGPIIGIEGISYCSKLPRHVAERQANSAKNQLVNHGIKDPIIRVVTDSEAISPGSGCVLWAKTEGGGIIGADALGERRKRAEDVGKEAAHHLLLQLQKNQPVDKHLADQLIIWMALAEGVSRIACTELTLHTITAIDLCETITGAEFEVTGTLGNPAITVCRGVGPI